ncbi:MAG TPA: serine/threonine-protein kinase [Pyrinomonadaceae bacterium]|nr:serine/threonine-protein kinase [Pyrinomonadaceae bacterium]
MKPERWQQISRIFKSAISLDGADRSAYVREKCGTDSDLREEVERLIESHQQAEAHDFIGGLAVESAAELFVGEEKLSLEKGQHFGSYVILDHLGTGGMGEVYKAQDSRLDRTVALKILSAEVAADKRRMQRFRQEARVSSSLNHPNIVTIFEFGEVDNLTFLATEFVDGETLRDVLRGKRLRLDEVIDIGLQMLAALDAAHEANIVHRDMKPENVMIRRRDHVVKVLDFGLAKLMENRPAAPASDSEAVTELRTAPGLIMGTVNYMSPEQARARAVDGRSDIWSVGIMIYEMVAGEKPFGGATSAHTIVEILEKDPPPLTDAGPPGMPQELQRIVAKSIAKDPAERYQTAKEMAADLRNLEKRLDVNEKTQEITSEPPKGKRWLAIALVAAAALVAAVFVINMWRGRRPTSVVETPKPIAPAPVERTLAYWITVQKFKDNKPFQRPFDISGEINFEAGYRIRLNVSSAQTGHLYVLNEGPATTGAQPEYNAVFPTSTANNGSEVLTANQSIKIPYPSWLKFDEEQGVEKLWLVFSEQPLPEMDRVKSFASRETIGLITDAEVNKALHTFLNSHSTNKVTAEKGETVTTVKSPEKVLVYAVRLEHH